MDQMKPNKNGNTFTTDVKKALNEYLRRMEKERGLILNKVSLTAVLNNRGIKVSKQTIDDIFNENENKSINFEVIVGICEVFGIHLSDLLPHKEDPFYGQIPPVWDSRRHSDIGVDTLPPRFYVGEYHCYYFRPAHLFERISGSQSETETQPILHGILTLKYENGITTAKLEEHDTQYNFDGTNVFDPLIMEGTVSLLIHTNQVRVNLRDTRGIRFIDIMFPYIHLAKDVLYSQVGAVFNISTGQNRYPLLQKMVLLRRELDLSNENVISVIRGILSMSSNEILVERSKLQDLEISHPIISQFPRKKGEYCVFYEDHIYTSLPLLENVDFMALTESLMHLRNISSSSAVLTIKEHERYNYFAKYFQRRECIQSNENERPENAE